MHVEFQDYSKYMKKAENGWLSAMFLYYLFGSGTKL
jgi:hypothetical protein